MTRKLEHGSARATAAALHAAHLYQKQFAVTRLTFLNPRHHREPFFAIAAPRLPFPPLARPISSVSRPERAGHGPAQTPTTRSPYPAARLFMEDLAIRLQLRQCIPAPVNLLLPFRSVLRNLCRRHHAFPALL